MALILVNGKIQQYISARDRGLHYGDGLFETFAVQAGRILAWERHITRLQAGCAQLGIPCPGVSLLSSEAQQLCAGKERAVLKLIISRGEGGRAYQIPAVVQVSRIFSLHDWPAYPPAYQQQGIAAGISKLRLGCNPALAGLKHLNRLEQVLLCRELSTTHWPETIVMDINDLVIEGSRSNVFLVRNQRLSTPDLSTAGIAGVIRSRILEVAAGLRLDCRVEKLELDAVLQADEVFFCNSVAGIWPVIRIQQRRYKVGPCTRQLQQQLFDENLIVMT